MVKVKRVIYKISGSDTIAMGNYSNIKPSFEVAVELESEDGFIPAMTGDQRDEMMKEAKKLLLASTKLLYDLYKKLINKSNKDSS